MISTADPSEQTSPSPNSAPHSLSRPLAILIISAIGCFLAVLPHLVSGLRTGDWGYWTNSDQMLYAAISKSALLGSLQTRDPYRPAIENAPVLYSWLQFVPIPYLLNFLSIGPDGLVFLWRFTGGITLGLSLYLLLEFAFQKLPKHRLLALTASIILISDPGIIQGHSFLEPFKLLAQRITNPDLIIKDDLSLPIFRVVTPITNFFAFLLCILAALNAQSNRWAIFGAFLLALNILIYFFFWTVLIPTIGCLFLWHFLNYLKAKAPDSSALHFRTARNLSLLLILGFLIGLPDILIKRSIQADSTNTAVLHRLCRGMPVPPGDPFRQMYLFNYNFYLKFFLLSIGLFFNRSAFLSTIWLAALFGFALTNSAILTGLEFENFHWLYVCNPMVEMGLLFLIYQLLSHSSWLRPATIAAAAFFFLMATTIRGYDSAMATAPAIYRTMKAQTASLVPALQNANLDTNAALVGPIQLDWLALHTNAFQFYHDPYTQHITLLSDEEVNRRHALNAYISGVDKTTYLNATAGLLCAGCPVINPDWLPENVKKARIAEFLQLTDDQANLATAAYSAVILLRPTPEGPPPRCGPWQKMAENPFWSLWRKQPTTKTTSP